MSMYRRAKINDSVKEELCLAIRNVKDPRVAGAFISITAAEVTADLKEAKIFFSVLGSDPKEAKAGLESAAGYLRRELAHNLNLRITPALSFEEDKSIANGARISKLIDEAMAEIVDVPEAGDDGNV